MAVDLKTESSMYWLDNLRKALEKPVFKLFGFTLIKYEVKPDSIQQLKIRVGQLEDVITSQALEEPGIQSSINNGL